MRLHLTLLFLTFVGLCFGGLVSSEQGKKSAAGPYRIRYHSRNKCRSVVDDCSPLGQAPPKPSVAPSGAVLSTVPGDIAATPCSSGSMADQDAQPTQDDPPATSTAEPSAAGDDCDGDDTQPSQVPSGKPLPPTSSEPCDTSESGPSRLTTILPPTLSSQTPSAASDCDEPETSIASSYAAAPSSFTISTSASLSSLASSHTKPPSSSPPMVSPSSSLVPASPSSRPAPAPSAVPSDGKLVVAHHMVGNTFPYTKQDWAQDIALAHASGIDGFALNTGREVWEADRINDAYEAARESKLNFKLFLSLDMNSLPCGTVADGARIRDLVARFMNHPNQLYRNGKAFVSTFAGQQCTFGQASMVQGWRLHFAKHSQLNGRIVFVPSFFIDPARFGDFAGIMDGDFNWNAAWPTQVTTAFARDRVNRGESGPPLRIGVTPDSALSPPASNPLQKAVASLIGDFESDRVHLNGLRGISTPIYMTSVSPWFFTHYGPNSFNKNWVYLSDQHLYARRWENMIQSRDQLDIVQVVTWNDYGEAHYVGPIKGAQPFSEAWTNGMPHTAWLELTQYYATAFKTGAYPQVTKDKILMWSRPHAATAESPDPVPRPDHFELLEDAVWAVVLTSAPSTVVLSTSPTSSTTFNVPAGVSKLSVRISPGGTMHGFIQRNGVTVVELRPSPDAFTFQSSPKSYNYNVFVASATAP